MTMLSWGRATLRAFMLLLPLTLWAEGEAELRDAVNALARTSYGWETTTRQRFKGDTTEPRLNPNTPIDVQGRFDPEGFTQFIKRPSRELPVPVTAFWRRGEVVALTPVGWLRRAEIRQMPGGDRDVMFEGQTVRLSRVFGVALKVSAMRALSEDLFDLIADLKSCRREQGLILGELREKTVEQLWGDAEAKRAPEIQGTVIFKIGEQGLTEYHVVIAIGFPNSRTKKVAWTTQQWSTRITGIGSTAVEPPDAVLKALER